MSFLKRDEIVTKSLGFLFLFVATFILIKTYFPVAQAEIFYQSTKANPSKSEIIPINTDFSIIIPKININAPIIKNVDPYNSQEYQQALTKGIAHAKTSALPGFSGNVSLFSHSAANWYQANQYNSLFYLIDKLEQNDQIIIYYENNKYLYTVSEKKIVTNTDINYLSNDLNAKTLTLMTCWPPGTTLKRLVIIAKLI